MADLNFKTDIKLGEKGEEIVLLDLLSMGCEFVSSNRDNKYDFIVKRDENLISYEVKTDVTVAPGFDTGNIFVEIECRNKKSGIEVTEADWFVNYLVFFGEIWYIKTSKLKELILSGNFPIGIGGDTNSKSTGYLINRQKNRHHFIIRMAPKEF